MSVSIEQVAFSTSGLPGFGKKESFPDISSIDNERLNTNIPILEPLSGAKEFEPLFSYLSRTRQLEIKTAKTEYLQKIAGKMTQNSNIQSRVVIMQKGKEAEAFCAADGTIFLSQSLLNSLDSVDEIAAVIAHESGHLLNHTALKIKQVWNRLGTAWIHEVAADSQAPMLLEKAGFNSLAFASAIEKLSGFERGIVHQNGLARASESVGTHFAINRRTSAQELLTKPDLLWGETKQSNAELFSDAYQAKDRKNTAKILELLHPKDLANAYRELAKLRNWEVKKREINFETVNVVNEDEEEIALQKKAANEIRKLLTQQGATEDEQTLVLMCISPGRSIFDRYDDEIRRFNEINDPNKIRDLARLLSKENERERLNELCKKAFLPEKADVNQFLKSLEQNLFDPRNTPNSRGIPVTEDSLLDALTAVSDQPGFFEADGVISAYLLRSNVKSEKDIDLPYNEIKIRKFLEEVKQRKILNSDSIRILSPNSILFLDHSGKCYYKSHNNKSLSLLAGEFPQDQDKELFKDEEIEQFFSDLKKFQVNINTAQKKLDEFLVRIENHFYNKEEMAVNRPTEDERLQIARKIREEMKKDERLNVGHGSLRYGISTASRVFKSDSERFYVFLNEVLSDEKIDELSSEQAFSYLRPFLSSRYRGLLMNARPSWVVSNLDSFSNLPIVQLALDYSLFESGSAKSLRQLSDVLSEPDYKGKEAAKSSFEDNLDDLILGQNYRKRIIELTQGQIAASDLDALYNILKLIYPDGPEKTYFLRVIGKKILTSPDLFFENKLAYLSRNLDDLGPEGLALLAEQIEDIKTYQIFRGAMQKNVEEYKSGKTITLKVAAIDLISSLFVKDFEQLFNLCQNNPDTVTKSSTDFAERWIEEATHYHRLGMQSEYDPDTDKFVTLGIGNQIFRTASEFIDMFHGLTPFERFAITHKALTEKNGALTNPENKKKFSHQIINALQIKNRFIKGVLESACRNGDAKFLTIPISRMVGPLLFRSLDKTKIDAKEISRRLASLSLGKVEEDKKRKRFRDLPPVNNIIKALYANRREVSDFGSRHRDYPQTTFFRLSQESNQQFQLLTQRLHELFDEPRQNGEKNSASEIDPSLEAIVKGLEGSGALGVRSLQLAVQMHEFSEPVRRRLSESFDQNPGLNKLLFWENLHKLSEEDQTTLEFVQKLRLKSYLGGGSLYTTFEAVVNDQGRERAIALKMLNPNSEAFLRESRSIAQTVLEDVRKQGFGMRKLADMGIILTDLAHQWCIKDINDQTFEQDDDKFREVVKRFNARGEKAKHTIPERVFNTYNLKAEDLALGRTVNKILNDKQVPDETKQILVRRMAEFFAFQLKGPKVQEEGQDYALVHSDPHVGNYIVDLESETAPIAVIDRHMYLRLESQDISVLEQFIAGNDLKFLSVLTERVLDINRVVNRTERAAATFRVRSTLMRNYFSQRIRGKADKFSLLRTALSEFQARGLDIPLNLRLMIRNIQALKNLANKYGLSFEKIYRDFKP